MDQLRLHASDLIYLVPELTLVITAIALSLADLLMPKQRSRDMIGWFALLGIMLAAVFVLFRFNLSAPFFELQLGMNEPIVLLNQSYRIDNFSSLFKLIFLGATALIIFMSLGSVKQKDIPHMGEFYYLFLPAVLGAMVMASSGDLITLFVGLELLSITSYLLVGMRKQNLQSTEGSFKYIVMGGISSAFVLYGMSFLYGMSGSTNIGEINMALAGNYASFEALIYISLFLIMAGLGFKIAAAPFHMWAPDVYQGAPMPVTVFLAAVSNAAGFAIIFRLIYGIFSGVGDPTSAPIQTDVFFAFAVLAAVSMIVGNVLALRQRNMKRLLAYSGIANAGYLLVPIATYFSFIHFSNFSEFFYYLIAYVLMNIGTFAVLMVVSQSAGHEEISGFAGLYYRAPWTAIAMIIFVLSLSGIPITAGFFGKLFIIMGTLQLHNYWLAGIMIGASVISYYYYFGIVRQMFMRTSTESNSLQLSRPLAITIWLCASLTVLFGVFPQWILKPIDQVFNLFGDLFVQ